MSLATNLAVADALHAAKTGLFRVMPDVPERAVERLRHTAEAFGLDWPAGCRSPEFQRSLAGERPTQRRLPARRSSGQRRGERIGPTSTARSRGTRRWRRPTPTPLLRCAGWRPLRGRGGARRRQREPPSRARRGGVRGAARGDGEGRRTRQPRRQRSPNLAEAVLLSGREGELFDGVIVDEDRHGPVMQIADPAILARVHAARVTPGDEIRVRLVSADVDAADGRVPAGQLTVRVASARQSAASALLLPRARRARLTCRVEAVDGIAERQHVHGAVRT